MTSKDDAGRTGRNLRIFVPAIEGIADADLIISPLTSIELKKRKKGKQKYETLEMRIVSSSGKEVVLKVKTIDLIQALQAFL